MRGGYHLEHCAVFRHLCRSSVSAMAVYSDLDRYGIRLAAGWINFCVSCNSWVFLDKLSSFVAVK